MPSSGSLLDKHHSSSTAGIMRLLSPISPTKSQTELRLLRAIQLELAKHAEHREIAYRCC